MTETVRLNHSRLIYRSLHSSTHLAQAHNTRPRWRCTKRYSRLRRKAYTSSDDEVTPSADEGSYSTDEGTWRDAQDSQHIQVEAAPPGPVASSKGSPLKTGGIVLAMVAVALALVAWYTRSARQRPKHAMTQHSEPREAPVSEADLDNTVRTLTEQRLGDGLTEGAMQGASIRQPLQCSWQPKGVGYAFCSTKTRFHHTRPVAADIVSGPAAVELLRLQVEYLVFLKQSDAIHALTGEPKKYIKL